MRRWLRRHWKLTTLIVIVLFAYAFRISLGNRPLFATETDAN